LFQGEAIKKVGAVKGQPRSEKRRNEKLGRDSATGGIAEAKLKKGEKNAVSGERRPTQSKKPTRRRSRNADRKGADRPTPSQRRVLEYG